MSLHPMYARPRDLEQASELLASLSTGAVIIAGQSKYWCSNNCWGARDYALY